MKKLSGLLVLIALFVFAVTPVAFAQNVTSDCNQVVTQSGNIIAGLLCRIALLLNTIVPILITLAVVYFIWGVVGYVLGSSEDAKKEGRDRMIWGLIGLMVIVSIWGLVNILKNFAYVSDSNTINVPCIASPGISCP